MDQYQSYIHRSRYARWLEEEGRRETWEETVDRYCDFMLRQVKKNTSISEEDFSLLEEIFDAT